MPLHKWQKTTDNKTWIEMGQIGNQKTDGNVAKKIYLDTIADFRGRGDKNGYRLLGLRNDGGWTTVSESPMISPTDDTKTQDEKDQEETKDDTTTKETEDWKYILVIIVFIIIVAIYIYLKKSGHIK